VQHATCELPLHVPGIGMEMALEWESVSVYENGYPAPSSTSFPAVLCIENE